jgi:hypothetical protein
MCGIVTTCRRLPLLWLAAAMTVAGTGCAVPEREASSTRSTTGPAVDRAANRYRLAAGRVCEDLDRRIAAIVPPAGPRDYAPYLERVLEIGTPALGRLGAIDPPPALARQARRAVALARAELALIRTAARAVRASPDPARTLDLQQRRIDRLVAREDAAWIALGIPACTDIDPVADAPRV